jgi:hypothetical protein
LILDNAVIENRTSNHFYIEGKINVEANKPAENEAILDAFLATVRAQVLLQINNLNALGVKEKMVGLEFRGHAEGAASGELGSVADSPE